MRRTKGKIFINQDNKYLKEIANGIEQVTYGSDETAFAWGCVVSCNPYLTFEWRQQGKIHTVETHLIGSYNLDNALVAVAVGRFFKIPAERISRAITAYEPTNNRSQLKKTENNELIIRCLQRKSEQHESRFRQFRHNACLAQSSHLR